MITFKELNKTFKEYNLIKMIMNYLPEKRYKKLIKDYGSFNEKLYKNERLSYALIDYMDDEEIFIDFILFFKYNNEKNNPDFNEIYKSFKDILMREYNIYKCGDCKIIKQQEDIWKPCLTCDYYSCDDCYMENHEKCMDYEESYESTKSVQDSFYSDELNDENDCNSEEFMIIN
jgi:hypothetical protein